MPRTAATAAAAIRIGRRVRVQGQAEPDSGGSVVGYCRVLATQRRGGHVAGAGDVGQGGVEGEAGPVVEVDRGQPLGQRQPLGRLASGRVGAGHHQPVKPGRGAGQVGAGGEGEPVPGPDRASVGGHRDRAGQVGQLGVGPEHRGQLGLPDPVGEQDPHGGAVPPVAGAEHRHRVRRRRPGPPDRCRRARRVGRPVHRPRRPGGRGLANHPLHDPQGPIHPGQDPGGRDQVTVVDIGDPVLPAHPRVVPAEPDQAQPVRGRGPAIEQAGLGQHLGADAHAHQQRITVSTLPLQPLDDRGDARRQPGGHLAQLRHHDHLGAGGQPLVKLPEAEVGNQVQPAGQRHRLALGGDGVEVERPGGGQHLIGGQHVGGVRHLRAEEDHRRRLARVVGRRRNIVDRGGWRAAVTGGVDLSRGPRDPGRGHRAGHHQGHDHRRRHPTNRPPPHLNRLRVALTQTSLFDFRTITRTPLFEQGRTG